MSRRVPAGHEGLVLGGGLRLALTILGPKKFVTAFCKKPAAAKSESATTTSSRRIKRSRAA